MLIPFADDFTSQDKSTQSELKYSKLQSFRPRYVTFCSALLSADLRPVPLWSQNVSKSGVLSWVSVSDASARSKVSVFKLVYDNVFYYKAHVCARVWLFTQRGLQKLNSTSLLGRVCVSS